MDTHYEARTERSGNGRRRAAVLLYVAFLDGRIEEVA